MDDSLLIELISNLSSFLVLFSCKTMFCGTSGTLSLQEFLMHADLCPKHTGHILDTSLNTSVFMLRMDFLFSDFVKETSNHSKESNDYANGWEMKIDILR